jgi:lactoylglutathione lyase
MENTMKTMEQIMETKDPVGKKARIVGMNHIALEVDDVDGALDFYGKIFQIHLRGRHDRMAFINLGDQFIALAEKRQQGPDVIRHFGLVVDDQERVRRRLKDLDIDILPGSFLDFLDPWGNRIQIVEYSEIQFTKAPYVLKGMGLGELKKTSEAIQELDEKGMTPE